MQEQKKLSISHLKGYFLTKEYDLFVFRLYSIIVVFFLPLFGFILKYSNPNSIEFFSHRMTISGYWLSIFILSFKIEIVRKYMSFFSYFGLYALMFWIIWIVQLNHFSPEYTIGFFLSFCSVGIICNSGLSLALFTFTTIVITWIMVLTTPIVEIDSGILLLSMTTIGVVYSIVMSSRSHVNKQLEILNKKELDSLNRKQKN